MMISRMHACNGRYADFIPDPFVNTSPLNEQSIDLEAHPRVAHVTLHAATTRPGDIIYIPSRWWHIVRSPPAPVGGFLRNLAYTVEVSTPPPPSTLPAPPSYVHRPAFSHELLLWVMSHRGGDGSPPVASAAEGVHPSARRMDGVGIKASGSCTAAKMGLEEPPPGTSQPPFASARR